MFKLKLVCVSFAVVLLAVAVFPLASSAGGIEIMSPGELKWSEGPPSVPAGAEVAVIGGDLSKAEPFVIRLKVPAGYKLMPHVHPTDEYVTVISGSFHFGSGDTLDQDTEASPPGSIIYIPTGSTMFFFAGEEGAVIQVHGMGPWGISYINPGDDPRN